MKKLLLLFIALCSSVFCYAQFQYPDSINFEQPSSLIRIDTAQANNIWQIGRPQKNVFDSAYSIPNAIVTDTLNAYPTNNKSSFYLYMPNPTKNMMPYAPGISFKYKINTDSLGNAGGYIEVSLDSGHTFQNIASITGFIAENNNQMWGSGYGTDTIQDSIPGFTGQYQSNWIDFGGFFNPCYYYFSYLDTLIFRFTFISDSVQNSTHEGWMIDDIGWGGIVCEGIHEHKASDKTFSIIPNPASDNISLKYELPPTEKTGTVHVYNDIGEEVTHFTLSGNQGTMQENTSTWPDGLYFFNLELGDEILAGKKVVVMH